MTEEYGVLFPFKDEIRALKKTLNSREIQIKKLKERVKEQGRPDRNLENLKHEIRAICKNTQLDVPTKLNEIYSLTLK